MSEADKRKDITVQQYLDSIEDEGVKSDALKMHDIMHKISGEAPILYGYGTIGFGVYKYHYKSGRKGEAHTLAFYPRKGKITIYLMDGTKRYQGLLDKLGKHSTTGYCIYIKNLEDIDLKVLTKIIEQSHKHITDLNKKGPVSEILWQS